MVNGLFAKSFHILRDRACLENVAADESHRELKNEMRNRMLKILREQKDPRVLGEGSIFETYGYSVEHGWNFYERFMQGEFTAEQTGWVNPSDYEKEVFE